MQKNWSDSLQLGPQTLKNRVVLAAMTRQRCQFQTGIPNQLLQQYYAQRTGAAIILTQCVAWSQRGQAFPGAACLFNDQHLEGWKKVVEAVHAKNSRIYAQIYHGGRACLKYTTRGLEPWAPSSIGIRDKHGWIESGYQIPHEMTLQEIEQCKKQWRKSVELAKQAGFDGIQIHAAHGYLIDEFLKSWSNKRKDCYGGSLENRCRFVLELTDIALQVFEAHQIGIKVSPCSRYNDQYDDNPAETYVYLTEQLEKRKIGFIQVREVYEQNDSQQKFPLQPHQQIKNICQLLRPHYTGILIANDSFNEKTGLEKIRRGDCDMVSYGRLYISNPDLAERILESKELNSNYDWGTFFRAQDGSNYGTKGYTDYPFYEDWAKNRNEEKTTSN